MPGGIGGAPEAVAGTPAFAGQRRLFPADLVAPPGGRDAAGWGVHRVMGTESEFGIHAPANPGAHHSVLSVELVNSYADLITHSGGAVAGSGTTRGSRPSWTPAAGACRARRPTPRS